MIRFAVDRMLGKLARWLRVLGYDTFYDSDLPFEELVERSRGEGRVLITRNSKVKESPGVKEFLLLRSERFDEQLRTLAETFLLDLESYRFSRCTKCNTKVVTVDREKVRDLVPPKSYAGYMQFYQCPSCQKVYWDGTHVQNTLKRLGRIFPNVTTASE